MHYMIPIEAMDHVKLVSDSRSRRGSWPELLNMILTAKHDQSAQHPLLAVGPVSTHYAV
jgi:hypothetical protein